MCDVLQLPTSTYYYRVKAEAKTKAFDLNEEKLITSIIQIFHDSRQNYGTRKIKVELEKKGWIVSRRRIGRIMKEQGLVSKYTIAQYKPSRSTCNESNVANVLNREFHQEEELNAVVSDLTYVRVKQKWHYICILVDLYNREIIGYSAGPKKDAALVHKLSLLLSMNYE